MDIEEVLDKEEALDDELVRHSAEYPQIGFCIKHPLVFSIMHHPQMNALVNQQFRHKKAAAEKALAEKNWMQWVGLHERPYRLTALMEVEDQIESEEDFWPIARWVWCDSENLHEMESIWIEIFKDRPHTDLMMDVEDKDTFDALEDQVTIFRGFNSFDRESGLSWTLDREKAEWFAHRRTRPGLINPHVATATIERDSIIAYLGFRGESEVIALPEDLTIQSVDEA